MKRLGRHDGMVVVEECISMFITFNVGLNVQREAGERERQTWSEGEREVAMRTWG